MAKSSRSKTFKVNNRRLKEHVFKPVEDARVERLAAKMLEIVRNQRPRPITMTKPSQAETPAADADAMDIDDPRPSVMSGTTATGDDCMMDLDDDSVPNPQATGKSASHLSASPQSRRGLRKVTKKRKTKHNKNSIVFRIMTSRRNKSRIKTKTNKGDGE